MYSVKIMNRKKKSDYTIRKWRDADYKLFKKISSIKVGLINLMNLTNDLDLVMGYIETWTWC